MQKKQFTVYGIVQGVGFRFFTAREAQKIGVTGYVKNLSDGAVMVVAGGSDGQLAQLHRWLQQGPPTARVERVLEQEYTADWNFSGFDIRR